MKKTLTLTFHSINGEGGVIVKKFDTKHENSLSGIHSAMVEVLPRLIEDGFVPFFYSLENGYRRIETERAWVEGNAMIQFQGYRGPLWSIDEL